MIFCTSFFFLLFLFAWVALDMLLCKSSTPKEVEVEVEVATRNVGWQVGQEITACNLKNYYLPRKVHNNGMRTYVKYLR